MHSAINIILTCGLLVTFFDAVAHLAERGPVTGEAMAVITITVIGSAAPGRSPGKRRRRGVDAPRRA
jgi:hypothetical protein